jgi:glycerophosphoryl diester phosphodiesterase
MLHPFLDHKGPIPFAHRGGASEAPENTMAAFHDAVSLGYRYLETDVHATADGVLVAFHDDDLSRTCQKTGRIQNMSWVEVRRVRVHGTEPIPLLTDILRSYPNVMVNIDCKTNAAVAPLIQTLRQERCLDRVCIGSFSDKRLHAIRESFGASLCSSMGPRQVSRLLLASKTRRQLANSLRGVVAQIPTKQFGITLCNSKILRVAKEYEIPVHIWTIDDEKDMTALLDLGIDGIMTDKTRVLKAVFEDRDLWY